MAFARRSEQNAQADQRGQGCDWLRRHPHRPARDGIEHPDRDLLQACGWRVHECAARGRTCCAPDHLVKANRTPGPRMPPVDDDTVVASAGTMGLVLRGCTTRAVLTPPWGGERPRNSPWRRPCRPPNEIRKLTFRPDQNPGDPHLGRRCAAGSGRLRGRRTAATGAYIRLNFREVRPSTSTRMWLGRDTRRLPSVDGAGCP